MLDAATRDQLATLLRSGATNRAAALALGIDKGTAARYRASLGLPPAPTPPPSNRSTLTIEQKFRTFTVAVEGGHLEWTGRRTKSNDTPVFTYRERTYTARSIAFKARTGRDPVGYVLAECEHLGCVAPEHMEDEPGRTLVRSQLAALLGRSSSITECTRGHDVATHRRYTPGGDAYCATCHDMTQRARRAAA